MNVSCPECRSVFRVDPAKLPPMAVRARCSVCGGVITVATGAPTDDEFSSNSPAMTAPARTASSAERPVAARMNQGLAAALVDTFAPPPSPPRAPTPAPSSLAAVLPQERPAAVAEAAPTVVKQAGLPPTPKGPAPSAGAVNRPVLFPPRPMMPGAASQAAPLAARPIVAPRPVAAPNASSPTSASAPSAPRQSAGFSAPSPAAPTTGALSVAAPPASAPAAQPIVSRPPAAPAAGTAPPVATRTPINPFLANDPHAKAKRLARALVSDLVTYFPQKRQDGLRDGTLKQLFKDEIQKSYEEYIAQVGREFAETTPHFQDALNDLLAGGQKVF